MKLASRMAFGFVMAAFVCFATLMSGQSHDRKQNLFACKNNWSSCNHSTLTDADKKEMAGSRHDQSISDCEESWKSCNRSALSASELAEVEFGWQ